ncbi:MAG: hypothetical protein IKO41_04510 [Lachnospiraceae bacterium]|nr:hypothetical protein [Lachnospiraceae bacterium]MBR4605468.1 hypothetical protein [Lachnospiraceae bacterium]
MTIDDAIASGAVPEFAILMVDLKPGQGKSVEEVFKRSDKAMYEDKIAMKAQRTD